MTTLIIGGSSGIGLALAELLAAAGTDVTIAGRSAARLASAAGRITSAAGRTTAGVGMATQQVDVADEEQVRKLLAAVAPLDHVVVTALDAANTTGPIADFALADAVRVIGVKLLGPWLVAKHAVPHLLPGASLTFTAGMAAHRPGPGGSMAAAVNGALEALTRALALELAPVRVNAVSPGWIDSPLWDTIAGAARPEVLAAMAARMPGGRVGRPIDVAEAMLALIRNKHITGAVLQVDGGQPLI